MPKQLSLPERIIIERMIHQDYSFASMGRRLECSASTISREVKNYRCFVNPLSHKGNDCMHFIHCLRNRICSDSPLHGCYGSRCKFCSDGIVCTEVCPGYESSHCTKHDKPPYTCDSCTTNKQKTCKKNHAYYTAHRANAAHHKTIQTAHSGIRMTPDELNSLGSLLQPLIAKGESLNHIYTTHADEITVSERTLYINTTTDSTFINELATKYHLPLTNFFVGNATQYHL